MIDAINQKGMSKKRRFLSKVSPTVPAAIAPKGRESIGSVMFDPRSVPIERSPAFFVIALMAVESSGRAVPTPTIIIPIKDCATPHCVESERADSTTYFEAINKTARPPMNFSDSFPIGLCFLWLAAAFKNFSFLATL